MNDRKIAPGVSGFRLWFRVFVVLAALAVCRQAGTVEVMARGNVPQFDGWVQDDAHLLSSEEEEDLERSVPESQNCIVPESILSRHQTLEAAILRTGSVRFLQSTAWVQTVRTAGLCLPSVWQNATGGW